MMNIIILYTWLCSYSRTPGHTIGAVGNCIPTPFSAFQPWPVERHSYLPDPSLSLAHGGGGGGGGLVIDTCITDTRSDHRYSMI